MGTHSWDVEFLADLLKTLGLVERNRSGPGVAPHDVAATLPGYFHSPVKKLCSELLPSVVFVRRHPPKLKLPRTWDVRVGGFIERADANDPISIDSSQVVS